MTLVSAGNRPKNMQPGDLAPAFIWIDKRHYQATFRILQELNRTDDWERRMHTLAARLRILVEYQLFPTFARDQSPWERIGTFSNRKNSDLSPDFRQTSSHLPRNGTPRRQRV